MRILILLVALHCKPVDDASNEDEVFASVLLSLISLLSSQPFFVHVSTIHNSDTIKVCVIKYLSRDDKLEVVSYSSYHRQKQQYQRQRHHLLLRGTFHDQCVKDDRYNADAFTTFVYQSSLLQ